VPFYLRKAFRVGPVRINLSKSGLGASLGVKGARISTGPAGSQFNAGRYGLYYRKRLGRGWSVPLAMWVGLALLALWFFSR
jgi:hypothetical protein